MKLNDNQIDKLNEAIERITSSHLDYVETHEDYFDALIADLKLHIKERNSEPYLAYYGGLVFWSN